MKYTITCTILAAVVASQGVAQGATFSNGGFENGSLSPWTVTQGVAQVVSGNYCCGLTGPGEGTFYATLSGGGDSLSTLSQTFDTVAGQAYDYSFLRNGANGGEQFLVEFADSAAPGTPFQTRSMTVNSGAWITFADQFTAVSTSTILRFTDKQPNGATDAAIDGVVISAVPEPATMTLAVAGLLGLLLAARRRAA